jgi:large-conductance mechanosensitive channel
MQMQPPGVPVTFSAQTNTLAWVSLISGIVSWVAVPVIGAIVAVITGHMAKREIRRTGEQGDTLATVGLVLGYLHLAVVAIILVIVAVVVFATLATVRSTTTGG